MDLINNLLNRFDPTVTVIELIKIQSTPVQKWTGKIRQYGKVYSFTAEAAANWRPYQQYMTDILVKFTNYSAEDNLAKTEIRLAIFRKPD